jgi:steroid delta-isomerase-like uncharacterized protein
MSIERNKALVRMQFERIVNRGELSLADETISPDYFDHSAPPHRARGPDSLKQFATLIRTAYPDVQVMVDEIIAEGDRVAVRVTMRGTHLGAFEDRPPTGKRVVITGTVWWRLAEGKIIERWGGPFSRAEVD